LKRKIGPFILTTANAEYRNRVGPAAATIGTGPEAEMERKEAIVLFYGNLPVNSSFFLCHSLNISTVNVFRGRNDNGIGMHFVLNWRKG
jgi:hypothetical protein